jgi:MFS superfamily sulfate permease-like transporter
MSKHRWFRRLPEWVVSDGPDGLQADVIAGLTTGAVIIPKAMAYAMIAGLPVQVGLYTALVPMVIYAVLGTSRRLSVSTTTTLAVLTAAQLGQVVPTGDPAALLRASATLAASRWRRSAAGLPPVPGIRGELYLRASTCWLQSWHRAGHCSGPDP